MNKTNSNFNEIFDVDYKTGTVKIKGTNTVVPSLRYDKNSGEIRSYGVKSFEKRSKPVEDDVEDYLSEIPETILEVEDDTKPDRETLIEVNGKLTDWDGSDILKTVDHHTNYRISTLGYVMNSKGQIKSSRDNYKRKNDKHQRVDLWKNSIRQSVFLHRLVAEAFIPNPDNLPEVHHIDGNPLNNRVDNLMWVSKKDHEKIHLEYKRNFSKELWNDPEYRSKYEKSINQVDPKTNEIVGVFKSLTEAHEKTGISISSISECINGRRKTAGKYKWEFAQ